MKDIDIIEHASYKQHRLVIIDKHDAVWLTHSPQWYDICDHIVWWLQPGKKAWLQLRVLTRDGDKGELKLVRVRAKRLSKAYVRMGN